MQEIHHQVKIIHLCNIGYRAIIGKELDDKEHQHEIAHIIDFIIFPFLPQQIQEYGIIGVIAKGAKGIKSKLRSVTEKISYGEFTIYYKKDKLSLLKEVELIDSFKNIRKDIELISYSSYLLDLAFQVWN